MKLINWYEIQELESDEAREDIEMKRQRTRINAINMNMNIQKTTQEHNKMMNTIQNAEWELEKELHMLRRQERDGNNQSPY